MSYYEVYSRIGHAYTEAIKTGRSKVNNIPNHKVDMEVQKVGEYYIVAMIMDHDGACYMLDTWHYTTHYMMQLFTFVLMEMIYTPNR